MHRHEAIALLQASLAAEDLAVFTTGMISREAFNEHDRDENLYVIGSMGLASPLALGMALAQPAKRVVAVDGDGSALMNLGGLAMIAREAPANFLHVVLDNEVYGSTGNQPSLSHEVDLQQVAIAAGYRWTARADSPDALREALQAVRDGAGPALLLVKTAVSEVPGIGRVNVEPEQLAARFRAVATR